MLQKEDVENIENKIFHKKDTDLMEITTFFNKDNFESNFVLTDQAAYQQNKINKNKDSLLSAKTNFEIQESLISNSNGFNDKDRLV